MKRKPILVVLTILVLVLITACGSNNNATDEAATLLPSSTEAEYRTVDIETLATILEDNSDGYTIINVHIPYAGEIDGTDSNIAFNDMDALTAALPAKDTPVILYCRSGNMSEQATRALVELGYTQVWDVPGGIVSWQQSGRGLEN
jgi:rhodanese-related sulfurtransferase